MRTRELNLLKVLKDIDGEKANKLKKAQDEQNKQIQEKIKLLSVEQQSKETKRPIMSLPANTLGAAFISSIMEDSKYKNNADSKTSVNVLLKLKVFSRISCDRNDLISVLNAKNSNEFGFSEEIFILLFELYKTGLVNKFQLQQRKNDNQDKGPSSQTTKAAKEYSLLQNFKEKSTSTYLDVCPVRYPILINYFGQNSLKSCDLVFKTSSESSILAKKITQSLANRIYNNFIQAKLFIVNKKYTIDKTKLGSIRLSQFVEDQILESQLNSEQVFKRKLMESFKMKNQLKIMRFMSSLIEEDKENEANCSVSQSESETEDSLIKSVENVFDKKLLIAKPRTKPNEDIIGSKLHRLIAERNKVPHLNEYQQMTNLNDRLVTNIDKLDANIEKMRQSTREKCKPSNRKTLFNVYTKGIIKYLNSIKSSN